MQTINLIAIKDPHMIWGAPKPSVRTDTFFEDIEKKYTFIFNYISDIGGIDKIISTGDTFDLQRESDWNFKIFKSIGLKLKEIKDICKTPLSSPLGNHDYINGRYTIDETPFEHYKNMGLIEYLSLEPVILADGILLFGIDYNSDYSVIEEELKYINGNYSNSKCNIVVIHQAFSPTGGVSHNGTVVMSYEFFEKFPNIHCFILGHLHAGFKTTVIKTGAVIVNNWSLVRLTRLKSIADYIPEFEHIIVSKETGKITTKTIQIPVRPFKEAFLQDYTELIKEPKFEFFSSFDLTDNDSLSDDSIIKTISKKMKINSEVYNTALQYINSARG